MRSVCTHMWTLSGSGFPEDDAEPDEAGGTVKAKGAPKAKGKAKAKGKRTSTAPDAGVTPQKKGRSTSTPQTAQKLPAPGQLLLGCSKCRFSKSGCAKCKKAVEQETAKEELEALLLSTGIRTQA